MKPRQPVFQGAKSDVESKDEERARKFSTLSVQAERFFVAFSRKKGDHFYGKASVYFRIRYRRTSR